MSVRIEDFVERKEDVEPAGSAFRHTPLSFGGAGRYSPHHASFTFPAAACPSLFWCSLPRESVTIIPQVPCRVSVSDWMGRLEPAVFVF